VTKQVTKQRDVFIFRAMLYAEDGGKILVHTQDVLFIYLLMVYLPIPVAERSKAWVCSRSRARIRGSNPAEGRDVYLF
jgi:hypothetical protein